MILRRLLKRIIIVTGIYLLLGIPHQVFAEVSYAGKTVRVLVGSEPGGGYDTYGRLLARHLGKHLPGNPTVIPENMPGGGGVRVMNYLYEVADPDGLTIGISQRQMYIMQLTKASGVQFDLKKMTWLGNATSDTVLLLAMTRTGIPNFEALKSAKKPLIVGSGASDISYFFPRLLQEVLNANIKIISGIEGSANRRLAILRGELDGQATTIGTALSEFGVEIGKGDVRFLIQTGVAIPDGFKRHSSIPDVPTIWEMNLNPEAKALVSNVIAGDIIFSRYFVAPPKLPVEQTTVLRKAFMETLADPSLLAEAKKGKRPIDPVDGATLQKQVDDVFKISPAMVERLKRLLENPKETKK